MTARVVILAPHLDRQELIDRLEISDGTIWAEKLEPIEPRFEPGAIVPKAWRRIAPEEFQCLQSTAPPSRSSSIRLVRIDQDIMTSLRALRDRVFSSRQARHARVGLVPEVEGLLRRLGYWRGVDPIDSIGFSFGPPWAEHTTRSADDSELVGLHFDSWDRLAPKERWRGQNRICVNMNAANRALLFVPVTADVVACRLIEAGYDIDRDENALRDRRGRIDLARRFLECFPTEPVLRLLVRPGEAYIAPTENLIHDGSSFARDGNDVTLTIRGFIDPCNA